MTRQSFLILTLIFLCGCENIKDTFGLARSQPDEFSVPEKPSLTIPKDFKNINAPKVHEKDSAQDPAEKAKKIISQ